MTAFALRLVYLVLAFASASTAFAQSGKAFFKEAEALRKAQELEKAVEKYGLAIAVDPKMVKAYKARAEVYALQGDLVRAAADMRRASELDPAESQLAVSAAKAYLDLDSFAVARTLCDQALFRNPKAMEALLTKARACMAMGDLDAARDAADRALALKATTDSYFVHGLVRTATGDLKTAEFDLDKVLSWNHMYLPAYVALAEVQLLLHDQYSATAMRMRTLDKAVERSTRALELDPQNTDALFVRSKAYAQQKEYAKAIDDISRCIALDRTDRAVYLQRARYYKGYGQHQNAVNDLNKLVLEDPNDLEALLLRAECRESNLDLDGALRDLDLSQRLMEADAQFGVDQRRSLTESRTRIAALLFELNRETDNPAVTVLVPYHKGGVAQVSASLSVVRVAGHVRDKSLLKSITVNGVPASYAADEKDPQFEVSIPLGKDEEEIIVQATDVYDNMSTASLLVDRTEGIAPLIAITSPKPNADREIIIEAGRESIFLEGRITDASLIRLIAVNGINASYVPDQLDPEFSIKVDVKDRERFTVRAEDQYGNAAEHNYTVIRKAEPAPVAVVTPRTNTSSSSGATGTTWLVHIENANYRNFPALQTNAGDAAKMQRTFANYNVQRTINKKNLSKEQMERFFNVELRDLVRTNKVNTILVWYSGHGRTQGGKAYWVPVDAAKDDIYSYFNYGSLKAQMQNYSETVNNTLVVSDAAGTDPSFYELTR
ncbi:MAG: tetratricopeptide repeat protein [Flavobacteriales bacterium]|nr:tetratricopeptide repeat protein [Flavobacteriales bacterium]